MDFDPDEAQQYLEGTDYPANKDEVASTAEGNGAPHELVERIRALGGFTGLKVISDLILCLPEALPLALSTRSAFLCHRCTS